MVATLTSIRSERVTFVRRLHDRSVRRERGLFVVEGPQGVREALKVPKIVEQVYVSERSIEKWPDIPPNTTVTTDQVLAAMSETEHPQGIIAVCRSIDVSLDAIAPSAKLIVVLHQASDPGNAGTILRTADAFGADAVIFTKGSVDPYNGKCVRSSTGSIFHIPLVCNVEFDDVISAMNVREITVRGTEGGSPVTLNDINLAARSAWVIGTEAHGLDEDALDRCNERVSIPMPGNAESLNASVAAAIVLYATAAAHNEFG